MEQAQFADPEKDMEAAYENNSRIGVPNKDAADLKDAIEIIHFNQIHVKITRAHYGLKCTLFSLKRRMKS